MKAILYISYWNLEDPLTISTVVPSLREIRNHWPESQIIFVNIQRTLSGEVLPPWISDLTIQYHAFHSGTGLMDKFYDYTKVPVSMNLLCKHYDVTVIIARGSPAGSLAYLLTKKNKLPFIVESFEPHADYMRDSKVWKRFDPRFIIQRYFEKQQKKFAKLILPVSINYQQRLMDEGVASDKIRPVPCCVDLDLFRFNEEKRDEIRNELNIQNRIVGIYVGKFGDIYYDDEAFALFKAAFDFFGEQFFLIILTQQDNNMILKKCHTFGILTPHVFVKSAAFQKVPAYLSAADFAFSTVKPAPSRIYCSPIKNGEYWANGLPILTEDGIGDDTDIIKREGGGVIIKNGNNTHAFGQLQLLLKQGRVVLAQSIQELAVKHRNPETLTKAYEWIRSSFK